MSSTTTPTTEIAKIQIRRGLAEDLPGMPASGNPTQPTVGLSPGELAFTTDTGQVFIGIDTTEQVPSINRATFPFQNIEVLTENSNSFLQNNFDYYYKDTQTGFYTSQPLAITSTSNAADIRNIVVNAVNSTTLPLTVSFTSSFACVKISYFLFDSNVTVRAGTISVIYTGTSNQPLLDDEFIIYPRNDLGALAGASSPNAMYGSIQFFPTLIQNGSTQSLIIQYRNITATNPILYFRLERPNTTNSPLA